MAEQGKEEEINFNYEQIPKDIMKGVVKLMHKWKLIKTHADKKLGREICYLIMKYKEKNLEELYIKKDDKHEQ